jgi:hypothetical protein
MTVTNPYYEFTPTFTPGTFARSSEVNAQYQAIQNAFDFLPGANDALTTDTAVFAPESGSGNAYVVTMPDTRTVNQDGDGVRFYAAHVNTGAATLNVDSIGAIAMVDRTGAALASGAITAGRFYVATYDAANTRFVLDVTINSVTNIIDTVQGSSTDDPTIATGSFDANLGFENSLGNALASVGFNSDADFKIKNIVAAGSGITGKIVSENDIGTKGSVFTVRSLTSSDGDGKAIDFEHQDGTLRASMELNSTGNLSLANEVFSGKVILSSRTAGGASAPLINGDPDADVELNYATAPVVRTKTAATGGLESNNTQTGGGFERVLTQSDSARTATTTELEQDTDAINTAAEKVEGFMVFNSTTNIVVWAAGAGDTDVWVDATGATAHTPV